MPFGPACCSLGWVLEGRLQEGLKAGETARGKLSWGGLRPHCKPDSSQPSSLSWPVSGQASYCCCRCLLRMAFCPTSSVPVSHQASTPLPVEDVKFFFHSFRARRGDAATVPETWFSLSVDGRPLLWCQSPAATPWRPASGCCSDLSHPPRQSHPVALGEHCIA